MKWTTVLFDCGRQAPNNWFHPFQKAQKGRKAIEKANKSLKAKFLSKSLSRESLRICELFFKSATCMCMSAQSECKHFHNTRFDLPLSLHANYTLNPTILHTLCNSFKQNQSSALPGYPSLFLTILKLGEDAWQHDRRFVSSSQQTGHYSTQNDFPVPLFVKDVVWVLNTHLRGSNSQKTRRIKDIFHLKTTQNTDTFIEPIGSTRQPDGDDHWPVTVTSKKRISAVPVWTNLGKHLFFVWLFFSSI